MPTTNFNEKFVQILPVGTRLESINYCRSCHGRVLAEMMDNTPIFWKGCPDRGIAGSTRAATAFRDTAL